MPDRISGSFGTSEKWTAQPAGPDLLATVALSLKRLRSFSSAKADTPRHVGQLKLRLGSFVMRALDPLRTPRIVQIHAFAAMAASVVGVCRLRSHPLERLHSVHVRGDRGVLREQTRAHG